MFGELWSNTYTTDIQTERLIYQSKATLDRCKISFRKIFHLIDPNKDNACKGLA